MGAGLGAGIALLHCDRDTSIAGMVLDSPFADLTQLCEDMRRYYIFDDTSNEKTNSTIVKTGFSSFGCWKSRQDES
ncbi:hypothetical protein ACHAXN_009681 [Cyclotella atomus]